MARSSRSRKDDPTTEIPHPPEPRPPSTEPADEDPREKPHRTCSDGTRPGGNGIETEPV